MKKYFFSLLLGVIAISTLQSQIKIGNNPQNIDASSVLELESNSRVLVITRINDAQMNTITPLEGALVYNIDAECVFYYNGTEWVNLCEENIFNETFEVVGEDLVLTDSTGDSVSVPLSDLGVYTFTNNPVFNPVDNDNTLVITQTGDNVNLEVGEITGFNIVDSSINGFLDIQDGSIVNSKLQDDSVDRTKIDVNVAGIGLIQAPDGSLDVDVTQITGTGSLSSPSSTLTISGDPDNSLFNNVGLDVADNAITNIKMADNSVGTAELINDAVTTDKILDASITNGKLDKPTIPISGFAPAAVNVDFGNNRLINVVDPIDITDAANKNYVDNAVGGLSNLADGTIYIGDAGNQAQEIAISGDATMDNAGVLTIEPDAVGTTEIIDGNVTDAKLDKANISLTGFAAPTADLSMNTFKLTDVVDPTDAQDAATKNYVDNSIATSNALANTNIFVGSATGVATGVAMTGDATINNAGVLTIEPNAVGTSEIIDANVTDTKLDKANIPLSGFDAAAADVDLGTNRLTNVSDPTAAQDAATKNYVDNAVGGLNTLADGTIYIGDGTNTAQEVALSGDATVNNLGVVTISANAINTTKILDNNVTPAKIEQGTNGQVLTTDGAGDVVWAAPAFSAVTTDATINGDGNATALTLADDAVTTIKVLDNNITPAKIEQGTNGQVLTTDGAGDVVWAAPAFSAVTTDATINGDGNATALSLADDAVTTIKVLDNNITPDKIEQGTNGQVLTTDGAGDVVWAAPAFSAVTTDATINGDGNATALSLADDAVTTIKVLDDNITPAKIEEGTANQVLVTNTAGTDVEWTDRSNITTTGTAAGSIFFAAPTTFEPIEDNAQLFWDDAGNRLGVGTNVIGTGVKLRVANGAIQAAGILNSDGTLLNPTYSFSNDTDTDTGMLTSGQDEIAFSVGEEEALRMDEYTEGNTQVLIQERLGIGFTLPANSPYTGTDANSTLEVRGSIALNGRSDTAATVNVADNDYTVLITGTSPLVNLPTADATNTGRIYILKIPTATGNATFSENYSDSDGSTVISGTPVGPGVYWIQSINNNWERIN